MRITLIAYGTRGDVQPFCAIALALAARGHAVRVAVPQNHVSFVQRCGLQAASLHGDSDQLLLSPEGQRWLATGNALKLMQMLGVFMEELAPQLERDIEAVTADADGLVAGVLTLNTVRAVAEARALPVVGSFSATASGLACPPPNETRAFSCTASGAPRSTPGAQPSSLGRPTGKPTVNWRDRPR